MQSRANAEREFANAEAFYSKGQFEEAIKQCKKTIEANPKHPEVYDILGLSYYDQGKYDEAIVALTQSLDGPYISSTNHFNLGLAYFNQENYAAAEICYMNALHLNAKDNAVYYNLGLTLMRQQKYDEAMQIFLKGFENFAQDPRQKGDAIKRNEDYVLVAQKIIEDNERQNKHLKAKIARLQAIDKMLKADSKEKVEELVAEVRDMKADSQAQ